MLGIQTVLSTTGFPEGYGGFSLSNYDLSRPGTKSVQVTYTVVGITKRASFDVRVRGCR